MLTVTKGTPEFFDLLDRLDCFLDTYWVTDDSGNRYNTKEKRILVPFLIAVRDREVLPADLCVFDLEEGQSQYDSLTDAQYAALCQ